MKVLKLIGELRQKAKKNGRVYVRGTATQFFSEVKNVYEDDQGDIILETEQ